MPVERIHMDSPEKLADEITKNVPFIEATTAGLADMKLDLRQAAEKVSPRIILNWLSWKYSLEVQNPYLHPDYYGNVAVRKSQAGIYQVEDDPSFLASSLPPTGFEGYFVGYDGLTDPERSRERRIYNSFTGENETVPGITNRQIIAGQVLDTTDPAILSEVGFPEEIDSLAVAKSIGILGAYILESTRIQHKHHDPNRVSRFFRILTTNRLSYKEDWDALIELDSIMGSIVGRLKPLISENTSSTSWQNDTHRALEGYLQSYLYEETTDGRIQEIFRLPPPLKRKCSTDVVPTWKDLPTEMDISMVNKRIPRLNVREGFAFLSLLGKVGNPLLRTAMPSIRRIAATSI